MVCTHAPCGPPSFLSLLSLLSLPSPSPTVADWEDESPYPEVRAAVSNTDDIDMPVDTIRAWTIGLLWSILIPGLNQFLYLRYPSITIGSVSLTVSLCSGTPDDPVSIPFL